jgi:hypothetical protein
LNSPESAVALPFLFIDIEASSLSENGFPIEVAWVTEAGIGVSALIRPEPDWSDWSAEAEALHRISRQLLLEQGRQASSVAQEMTFACKNRRLVSDSPAFDQAWLVALFRVLRLRAPRVRSVQEAYAEIFRPFLAKTARGSHELLEPLRTLSLQDILDMVADAQRRDALRDKVSHRALDDALSLWWIWNDLTGQAAGAPTP